ncbi:MAG: hypothetical protein AAF639_01295 [Chloroflexota bacterium]
MQNQQRWLNRLLLFSYIAVTIGIFCSLFVQPIGKNNVILDDAYMFVRYADNLFSDGNVSWNPGGPPTFGLTSILYWAVMVVPIRSFVDSASATAILASFLSGCLFLVLMMWMVIRHTNAGPVGKRLMALLILVLITNSRGVITTHFLMGMDTLFALVGLTVYILLCKWHEQAVSWGSMIVVSMAGALLGSVRPDLLLYAFMVPASLFLFTKNANRRWVAVGIGVMTSAFLLLMIGAATTFLNSPLPLPFYAKGLTLYGHTFYQVHRYDAFVHAKDFIAAHHLLLAALVIGILSQVKSWWRGLTPVDRGILGAAILFFIYMLFFVTSVTGKMGRLYYPLLPVIIFLSVRTFSIHVDTIPHGLFSDLKKHLQPFFAHPSTSYTLLLVVVILFTPYLYQMRYLSKAPAYSFDVHTHYTSSPNARHTWFALDQLAALPADITMATTEIGLVAAMNPHKTLIDLAGLNDSDIAHHGFSAERLLQTHQPDFIYLPHPHYQEMRTEILNNQRFQEEYVYFSAEELNALMDIAIHTKSKYYTQMLQIVQSAYE